MIMPFLYRYPFLSVCTRGLASSFSDKNLFFVWTSTQYLLGGNVTCQTVTCYSEFVSALSVGLASLCPSPSGLNYFVMAALKCRNSLQFSGFHLSSCWRRRCPTRFRGQLRAVSVLSASPFTGCDAIVRSGISFHGESFTITPVEARSRLV